jgi:cytochrome c peroxidase
MSSVAFSAPLKDEPILPIPEVKITSPGVVALGEKLFHDARLSSDQTVSCASCHLVSKGGADGRKVSIGVEGRKGTINAPSVFNSSLNVSQFWDGRAKGLIEQIEGPIHNPHEMNADWKRVIKVINQDKKYMELFDKNYADGVNVGNIKHAIVAFEETLLTPNSRFDQYLRGDSDVLSNDEKLGYKLFKEYGCASCHQGVGVGGNMYQKLGVVFDYPFQAGSSSNSHLGRFNVTGEESDRHVFKVPSLRNVAKTAPYLHDGSKATLPEVVKTMMVYQLGVPLSPEDVQLIVSFLGTLTGEYQGKAL